MEIMARELQTIPMLAKCSFLASEKSIAVGTASRTILTDTALTHLLTLTSIKSLRLENVTVVRSPSDLSITLPRVSSIQSLTLVNVTFLLWNDSDELEIIRFFAWSGIEELKFYSPTSERFL